MPNKDSSGPLPQRIARTSAFRALHASETLKSLNRPERLTVRFSRASDIENFVDLYSGPRKYQIDPKGFIRERSYQELVDSVSRGAAVLALDENGHIRASALAQRHNHKKNKAHTFTEIGAVMCDVSGVGLPKLVVGMLSLKQQFDPKASARVYAKVAHDNTASNHVFDKSMRWERVRDERTRQSLFDAAYAGKDGNRTRTWYEFKHAASDKAEEEIKKAIQHEALHGKDGRSVPLDVMSSSFWSTLQFHEMLSCQHDMD